MESESGGTGVRGQVVDLILVPLIFWEKVHPSFAAPPPQHTYLGGGGGGGGLTTRVVELRMRLIELTNISSKSQQRKQVLIHLLSSGRYMYSTILWVYVIYTDPVWHNYVMIPDILPPLILYVSYLDRSCNQQPSSTRATLKSNIVSCRPPA